MSRNSRVDRDALQLTPDERADWEYYVKWYREHGWIGTEANKNAWQDLQRKYPRLEEFKHPPGEYPS